MLKIGIFEIEPDPTLEGRWLVTNTLTTFKFKTYGTQEEIETEYKNQSDTWEKRVKESGTFRAKGRFSTGGAIKKAG